MKKELNNELTIIIKTFERYRSLKKMLTSICKENLEEFRIIILDDSKKNYKIKIMEEFSEQLTIKYIISEFDIGVCEGRNRLLKEVETPYFLLCDDDYIFDFRTKLKENLEIIKKMKLDILGGSYYNRYTINNFYELYTALKHPKLLFNILLKKEILSNYTGNFKEKKNKLYLEKNFDANSNVYLTEIVNNFFIGNTEKIIEMGGWDKDLKIAEHEEFFYRAKRKKIKVGFSKTLGTLHFPVRSYKYSKYRCERANYYTELWLKKYNLKDLVITL